MKKVWVVTGQTESSDAIGPYVFRSEPTENDWRQIAEWFHEEDCANQDNISECGPGYFGSYSHFQIEEVEVQ